MLSQWNSIVISTDGLYILGRFNGFRVFHETAGTLPKVFQRISKASRILGAFRGFRGFHGFFYGFKVSEAFQECSRWFQGISRGFRDVIGDFRGVPEGFRGVPGAFQGVSMEFQEISGAFKGASGACQRCSTWFYVRFREFQWRSKKFIERSGGIPLFQAGVFWEASMSCYGFHKCFK